MIASAGLYEIDATTVRSLIDAGEAVLVDVREAEEWEDERIPGATLAPLSAFDPQRIAPSEGKRIVLHCLGGTRSAKAAEALLAAGHPAVFHLKGGLFAWKEAGFNTISH